MDKKKTKVKRTFINTTWDIAGTLKWSVVKNCTLKQAKLSHFTILSFDMTIPVYNHSRLREKHVNLLVSFLARSLQIIEASLLKICMLSVKKT